MGLGQPDPCIGGFSPRSLSPSARPRSTYSVGGSWDHNPMDDNEFKRVYPVTPNEDLMRILGCSRSKIQVRARNLGVRKDPRYRSRIQAERMRGRKRSTETRQKIAERARGREVSSQTTAKRIATLKANGRTRGSNHYNWKGGRTWERFAQPAYVAWRNAVLDRDGYRCQDCGRRCAKYEKGLAAHHLKSYAEYPDLRFDVNNGVTLCRSCHMARHRKKLAEPPRIQCACGCGTAMDAFDRYGRPRMFVNHHHRRGVSSTASRGPSGGTG